MPKKTGRPPTGQKPQRRAPTKVERSRDAERSRRRLLAAALDEFSEKGFAGARVSAIAERAGLNKQLITYYFGGKQGLYRELGRLWLEREAEIAGPELPLDELMTSYLRDALADPRMSRLLLWEGLTGGESAEQPQPPAEDPGVADIRQRQARGEVADDLEPAMALIALMAIALAPISMPQVIRRSTGLDPEDPEFERLYAEQLARMVRHLAS